MTASSTPPAIGQQVTTPRYPSRGVGTIVAVGRDGRQVRVHFEGRYLWVYTSTIQAA